MVIKWARRTYTQAQFITAWISSQHLSECARKLGLTVYGSTYATMRSTAIHLGLDFTHMRGKGHNTGSRYRNPSKKPISTYLTTGRQVNTNQLRKRLIQEGLVGAQCAVCGLIEWNSSPIPLELDHINGINTDNRLCNLRVLCPNCHAQTATYCGKNKRKK